MCAHVLYDASTQITIYQKPTRRPIPELPVSPPSNTSVVRTPTNRAKLCVNINNYDQKAELAHVREALLAYGQPDCALGIPPPSIPTEKDSLAGDKTNGKPPGLNRSLLGIPCSRPLRTRQWNTHVPQTSEHPALQNCASYG